MKEFSASGQMQTGEIICLIHTSMGNIKGLSSPIISITLPCFYPLLSLSDLLREINRSNDSPHRLLPPE